MEAGEGCWDLDYAGSHIQTESARPLFESPHTVHAFANRHRTPVRYRARKQGQSHQSTACLRARYRTGLALRNSLRRNLVHCALALLESAYVSERRIRDVFQGFFSEKALVAGDDDVGKGEQAREDVIPDDLI